MPFISACYKNNYEGRQGFLPEDAGVEGVGLQGARAHKWAGWCTKQDRCDLRQSLGQQHPEVECDCVFVCVFVFGIKRSLSFDGATNTICALCVMPKRLEM